MFMRLKREVCASPKLDKWDEKRPRVRNSRLLRTDMQVRVRVLLMHLNGWMENIYFARIVCSAI